MIDGIEIKPCPLYAKIVENDEEFFSDSMTCDRKYLYSFQGGYQEGYMSDIRLKIFNMNHPKNCYIKCTGGWHFNQVVYNKKQNKDTDYNIDKSYIERETEYKQLLKDSRFTLCPSGSGPNSIRFWEALGAGSIPILLSDNLELPYHSDWNESIVVIKESNINQLDRILKTIDIEKENKMRQNCLKIYRELRQSYKGR